MTTDGASRAEATASIRLASLLNAAGAPLFQDAGAGADQVSSLGAMQEPQEAPPTEHQDLPEATGYPPISDDLDQSVALADGNTSNTVGPDADGVNSHQREDMKRTSRPRAAAAAANAVMAEQAKEEDAPLSVVVAKALSSQDQPKPLTVEVKKKTLAPAVEDPIRRPSRAAAAAANAGMARQVKEEEGSFGTSISPALVSSLDQDETEKGQTTKRRSTETPAAPAAKRSRMTATNSTKKVAQNTLEYANAGNQLSRGKKRRQAPVFEAAPIITDLPPLPFTSSSPELKGKGKAKNKLNAKTKTKTKANHSVKEVDGVDARRCEFCKKVANICVLLHCHACRRVYHAQCLVEAFKPYVDANAPILDQMERLQLEAPERRGNIFRCASCKAAFVDFYEGGGHLWECDCPTCEQPDKMIFYRQRKLVQMMNDMELEKQRKKEQKDQKKNGTPVTAGKPPISILSRSTSTSRSRRTRGSNAADDGQVTSTRTTQRSTSRSRGLSPAGHELKKESEAVKAETTNTVIDGEDGVINEVLQVKKDIKAEPMDADGGSRLQTGSDLPSNSEAAVLDDKTEQTPSKADEQQRMPLQPKDESKTPQKEQRAPKITFEPVGEPEHPQLSGDELIGAVRIQRDDKGGGWCFLVMCSRTSSLRESGMMKTGKCKWFPKKVATIECNCCEKVFSYSEFVRHTDSNLVKNAKCANEDPMPYLFVEHRDTTQYSELDQFLPALRSWARHQSANNTPKKSRRGHAVKQEALAAVVTPRMTMTNPEEAVDALPAALSRLGMLALFKRPKPRSDKTSTAARLSDPATFDFVAQIVCISPKYVMNMANGSLADRVVRSRTPVPGDSFPRKAGWLAFNRKPATSRHITCVCCEKSFSLDDFVGHAGISLSDPKMKARQLLYVVEREDDSALVPFNIFLPDLELVTQNGVDVFLDELQVPPPSPRPI